MSFRWKVFLISLAFSLLPVVVVSLINHEVTDHTAELLSQGAAETMQDVVRDNVIQMVSGLSDDAARSKRALILSVDMLAQNVRQSLDQPPARAPETVYSLRDFRSPQLAPDDMADSSRYAPPGRDYAAVSIDHPVFLYADGSSIDRPDGVYPADVRAMAAAAPFMRRVLQAFPNIAYRVYASLESGLHCSLPGHGEFSNTYDPRDTIWYRHAVEAGEAVWTMPLRDASTRRFILTASAPIRDAAGRIVGVAGLDVLDTVAMGGQELTKRWGSEARAFLVYPQQNPETGRMDLRVAASRPPQAILKHGDSPNATSEAIVDHPWFDGLASADRSTLLDHLETQRPGSMEVRYDGAEYLLAYSTLETLHFLILVPQSAYMSLPNRVNQSISGVMDLNLLVTGGATALILVAVFALAYFGMRHYTRPLLVIADAARRLGEGDFSVHLDIQLKDERDQLVRALNEMGPKMEDHLRIRHALAVAEEVQRNFLPNSAPRLDRFDIQGASLYCDETGGDYYDFIPFKQGDENTIAVIVGDVSGHGVPSALLMATARALLRCLCAVPDHELSLDRRVGLVNHLLCADVEGTGRFMTLFFLEIQEAEDSVRWVRAGHDPALLYDPEADDFRYLEGDGIVMGVQADYEYTTYEIALDAPGLVLAMGTDGIWEARDASGEMYGKQRFRDVIRSHAHMDASAIFDAVIRSLREFVGDAPFDDDVTLVIVKRR